MKAYRVIVPPRTANGELPQYDEYEKLLNKWGKKGYLIVEAFEDYCIMEYCNREWPDETPTPLYVDTTKPADAIADEKELKSNTNESILIPRMK